MITVARVELKNLGKTYDDPAGRKVLAVKGLNLSVAAGELLVLMGPSGCGKTTTLRLIAGLEEPTTGQIEINGQVINQVPPAERNIAMVFQNHALLPHLTAYDNLAVGLRIRRVPLAEIDQRVRETAALLGVTDCLPALPRALSGGQRQRIALGRALVRQPQVFLLDEPLSSLDAALRAQLRQEILRLHKHLAATMIYVTHDADEANTLGDRVVRMANGAVDHTVTPGSTAHETGS